MTDPLDIEILPADQRRAAALAEAFAHDDGDAVAAVLADLVAAGPDRILATAAVTARNLAAALVGSHGRDTALRILTSTRLDAAVAEPDE